MNKALHIKNWNVGGNSYVLKGNPKNKWVGFQESVINKLKDKFEEFNIVIWTSLELEYDYYNIPFSSLKHLFTEEHKTTGKYKNRWTAIILDHNFQMHSNKEFSVDVSKYYGTPLIPKISTLLDEDYFIENAKAEINIRIGQSKFRKEVLSNFHNRCAITNITENSLLVASHIIPWAHDKNYRGNFRNGICLYIEIDKFFDKGYISFSDDGKLIVSSKLLDFSDELKYRIQKLENRKLNTPKHNINSDFLKYHRENIFLH